MKTYTQFRARVQCQEFVCNALDLDGAERKYGAIFDVDECGCAAEGIPCICELVDECGHEWDETGSAPQWTRETVIVCDGCNRPMLPNVSTLDNEGCAWICLTPNCSDFTGDEIEVEDLTAVGVPEWVAELLAALFDKIEF